MKKLCTTSMAALLTIGGGYAIAQTSTGGTQMSRADCQAIWAKADASGSGSLSAVQAKSFVSNFKSVDANADGKLSSTEFLNGCQQGLVSDSAGSGAGAGTSGSSSPASPPPKQQY